ncbi:hypothetical protein HK405_007492, partial [Cladochytrium tenue]
CAYLIWMRRRSAYTATVEMTKDKLRPYNAHNDEDEPFGSESESDDEFVPNKLAASDLANRGVVRRGLRFFGVVWVLALLDSVLSVIQGLTIGLRPLEDPTVFVLVFLADLAAKLFGVALLGMLRARLRGSAFRASLVRMFLLNSAVAFLSATSAIRHSVNVAGVFFTVVFSVSSLIPDSQADWLRFESADTYIVA